MSEYRRSVLKIGPGTDPVNMIPFHKVHPDLKIFRYLGMVNVTFQAQEAVQVAGNLRLYPVSEVAIASWTPPYITRCAHDELLDFIDFERLDCVVCIRTWTHDVFRDYTGIFSYIPAADSKNNQLELFDVVYSFTALREV